jgi:LacI family transcriptional regulator
MTKPTISDVARLAGVSEETVSGVIDRSPRLDAATLTRIEQAIAFLGYVPDAPVPHAHPLIALIHDNTNLQLVQGAEQGVSEAIRDTDFAMIVRAVDRRASGMEQDLRRFLETHRPAGVLLLPGVAEMDSIVRACRDIGCPYVRMAATAIDDAVRLVVSNDREAAAKTISYLIGLSHRRIGLVAGPDEAGSARERELGYLDAMADHELDRGPALIATGDFSFESGIAAGNLLLEVSPSPTAIFAVNDSMAAGVLHAARVRGIAVPGQLSIVGFEDTPIAAQVWPPLTTVHIPVAVMACGAVFKMIYPEQAETLPAHFPLELISRDSVAPADA